MRHGKWVSVALAALLSTAIPGGGVPAAATVRSFRTAGMGDENVDLAVRRMTVSPVRAYVGDTVRIGMIVENKAEGMATTEAAVYANGKKVAYRLFTWGSSPGERLYRLSFDWDTSGVPPGEYRIRGEAFVWEDSSPFDNRMDVGLPVLLARPGASFPGGEKAGGSAVETDPRFEEGRAGH